MCWNGPLEWSDNPFKINDMPTKIFGLLYEPRFVNESLNAMDSIGPYNEYAAQQDGLPPRINQIEMTDDNVKVIESVFDMVGSRINNILEIGMSRNPQSSTDTILTRKSSEATYLGVDIRQELRSYENKDNNVFVHIGDSRDQSTIRARMKELGMDSIDLLFIDGDHSIDYMLNDWGYADLLSEKGVVIAHDTNYHPGPREVFRAIDRSLFNVDTFCKSDWGIGVAVRK